MEKKWIRCFRLFGAYLLILVSSDLLLAQNSDAISTSRLVDVKFEIPIEAGDANAARDKGQAMAFEKAMEQAIPSDVNPELRAQRIKQAMKFVKSFRALDETNLGDRLVLHYQVEIQASAFEGLKAEVGPPSTPKDWNVEIVFKEPTSAASLVDRIEQEVKVTMNSFKLTRSALILSLTSPKPEEQLRQEIQGVVGQVGQVSLFPKALPVVAIPDAQPAVNALQPEPSGTNSVIVPQ